MASERAPELSEVIRRAVDSRLVELHTWLPARVVAYDPTLQTVDCKPLVRRVFYDETDTRQVESIPVIPAVPIVFPSGGGQGLVLPPAIGDFGMLAFAEASVDRWLAGTGLEVDPEFDHDHALPDAFYVPGLFTFGAPRPARPTDHGTLGADAGPQIHLRPGGIVIGDEAGSKALGLDGDTVASGTTMATWIAALTVYINAIAPGTLVLPTDFGVLSGSAAQAKAK